MKTLSTHSLLNSSIHSSMHSSIYNSMKSARLFCLAVLLTSTTLPLHGQDDATAGLFCEARQLPLISQSLTLRISDGGAVLEWVQVFVNDGESRGQADYRLQLPMGATIESFGFWREGTFLAAELKERSQARQEHRQAAAKGKATGLAESKGDIHSFSVFPVPAGEMQQVQVKLRLPIVTERGRNSLRLPVDEFLGQAAVTSSILIEIETEEPLRAFGVDGDESLQTLDQGEHWATLFTTTNRPLDLWWAEESPPLLTRAEAVPLGDGRYGLQVRLALNDAGEWAPPTDEVILLMDSSYSVRRRSAALIDVVDRVLQQSQAPLRIVRVTDKGYREVSPRDRQDLLVSLLSEGDSLATNWQDLVEAARAHGCESSRRRCLALTDPQVSGLQQDRPRFLRTLFLTDPHELDFFAGLLGPDVATFLTDIDPKAKLSGLVDEMVRPALAVENWSQDGSPLETPGSQRKSAAEGGLLRLFTVSHSTNPIQLSLDLAGRSVEIEVLPEVLTPESRQGKAIRHGVFRSVLVQWMADYRRHRDPALKKQIVELSLAESIPTAFTSLHVADPSLSLSTIKPGDPLLEVPGEPGLVEVIAWYPFGELRELIFDPESHTFSDRFLVPRGWEDRGYRIEIFKRYSDGRQETAGVWYQLDDRGPEAEFYLQHGKLMIDTGEATVTIGAVEIHLSRNGSGLAAAERSPISPREARGQVLRLSPLGNQWAVALAELPPWFTVVLRDRAGNRSHYQIHLTVDKPEVDGPGLQKLEVQKLEVQRLSHPAAASTSPSTSPSTTGSAPKAAVKKRLPKTATVTLALDQGGNGSLRFAVENLDLRSREILSSVQLAHDQMLLGTAGGDLLHLDCLAAGGTNLSSAKVSNLSSNSGVEPKAAPRFVEDASTPSHSQRARRSQSDLHHRRLGSDCIAHSLSTDFAHHPIRGLARLTPERTLIGVLGKGLFELRGERIEQSSYGVGSRFVTGVTRLGQEVFVATAYNGLWRLLDGRAIRSRFPEQHITSLQVTSKGLEITSGSRLFLRHGRDRFSEVGRATLATPPKNLTSAVRWGNELLGGSFDGGLVRITETGMKAIEAGLSLPQRRINALVIADGHLWMGTEGGLLRLSLANSDSPATGRHSLLGSVEVILKAATHAITLAPAGLVAATVDGLIALQPGNPHESQRLLGGQSAASRSSFTTVAWFAGELYAGGLEGLFRLQGGRFEGRWFEDGSSQDSSSQDSSSQDGSSEDGILQAVGMAEGFDGGWTTALLVDGDRLWVGTYDRGVYALQDGSFSPVAGLTEQWVPPGALAILGEDLWVGGLGMAPIRLGRDGVPQQTPIPVQDVNGFVTGANGEAWFLTSEGPFSIQENEANLSLVTQARSHGI